MKAMNAMQTCDYSTVRRMFVLIICGPLQWAYYYVQQNMLSCPHWKTSYYDTLIKQHVHLTMHISYIVDKKAYVFNKINRTYYSYEI